MKKTILFFISMLVAAGLGSCTKETTDTTGNGRKVVLTGRAAAPDTRTSFGDVADTSIPFLWSADDAVWVNGMKSKPAESTGETAQFVFENLSGEAPFKVYYNETGDTGDRALVPAEQTQQAPYAIDLGANGDFGYALSDTDGNFTLSHMASYIWFDPYTTDIKGYQLTSISIAATGASLAGRASITDGEQGTVEEGSESVVLSFPDGGCTLNAEPDAGNVFAAAVVYPADLTGKTVKVTYTFADENGAQVNHTRRLEGMALKAGDTYRISAQITAEDLQSVVLFQADGGEWSETIPDGFTSLNVKTEHSGVVTEDLHAEIAAAMGADAVLDFSAADNETASFGNYYANNTKLKSIVLPRNITEIADGKATHDVIHTGCFGKCTNLETVTLPETLTKIGVVAFYKCSALRTVNIPASVTEIGKWAFYCCSSLEAITLPDNITVIPQSTFNECSSLRTVLLPSNLTEIGKGAFYGCESLESLDIPAGVRSIPDGGIASSGVFANCKSLRTLTLHEGLETIGEHAFYNCYALEELTLPATVTEVGQWAFYEARSLKKARFDAVDIGGYCMWINQGYSSLEELTFGPRVQSIGRNAFLNSNKLATITFESTECPTIAADGTFGSAGADVPQENRKINVPEGSAASYAAGLSYLVETLGFTISDGSAETLPDGVYYSETGNDGDWHESFDDFSGNYIYVKTAGAARLTEAQLNSIATFITSSARLTVLDMHDALYEGTAIPDMYLGGYTGNQYIFEISFPANIEKIGKNVCAYCANLRAVILGANVTEIDEYAFTPGYSGDKRTAFVCRATTPPTLNDDGYPTWSIPFGGGSSIPMYVPDDAVETYSTAAQWSTYLVSTSNIVLKPLSELSDYSWREEL